MTTLDDTYQILKQIRDDLPALLRQIQVAPVQIVTIEGLSDISKRLGLVQAGEFRSGNGLEPGFGFSGVRIGYPSFSYNSELWNIAGVENDVLQVGISATTGKLVAGGGDVFMDQFGFFLKNQEGLIGFQDLTSGTYDKVTIYINGGDTLIFENSIGGKAIELNVDTATHNVLALTFQEFSTAEVSELVMTAANGAVFRLEGAVEIWGQKDGVETVFNENSYDIDERHEGATDVNLWKLDAGLDRIGIGVAVPTVKLDVNGTINIATGNTYKINGTDVISATKTGQTTEEIQDIAGAMVTGNTETGITVTYQDSDGTIDFELVDEYLQDVAGAMFTGNTESGVTVTYQDSDGTIDVELTASVNSGWTEVSDTWTYNVASAVTVPSDATLIYSPGMHVRFKQGGDYKYYDIESVLSTKITFLVNTDYTVANAAITNIAYSVAEAPYGFPREFNFTPSITNLTQGNGTMNARYTAKNREITGHIDFTLGSSSAVGGTLTLTLPTAISSSYGQLVPIGIARYKDATGGNANSGVIFSSGVLAVLNSSGTYATGDALSGTVPFTWATSDIISFDFSYISAI